MAKSKKKNTTSKKKRVFPTSIKKALPEKKSFVDPELADPDGMDDPWGEEDDLPQAAEPEVLEDATKGEVSRASLLRKYPSPKRTKIFAEKWNEYLPDVAKRENFKRGHLSQLAMLCDLHVEYEKLADFIDKKGYSYITSGRNGVQHRQWPQVAQRNRCVSEIRMYSKILGLILTKDKELGNDDELDKEW